MARMWAARWWIAPTLVFGAVAMSSFLSAVFAQVSFEPTSGALLQAWVHKPQLYGSTVALAIALGGVIAQVALQGRSRTRVICLAVVWLLGGAALLVGAVVTHRRSPSLATIEAAVRSVPAPTGATLNDDEPIDWETEPDYPTAVRTWTLGPPYTGTDTAAERNALAQACATLGSFTAEHGEWREVENGNGFCEYDRVTGHVLLQLSASLVPDIQSTATARAESVTIRLRGVTAMGPG